MDDLEDLMGISSADVAEFEEMAQSEDPKPEEPGTILDMPLRNSFEEKAEGHVSRTVSPQDHMRPELFGDARFAKEMEAKEKGNQTAKKGQPPGGFTKLECSVDQCKSTSASRRKYRMPVDGTVKFRRRPYRFFPLPSETDPNEWIDFAVENPEDRENWKAQVANCQVLGIGLENCPFRICERHFRTAEPTKEEPNPVHKEHVPYYSKSRHSSGDSKSSENTNLEENGADLSQNTILEKTIGYEYLGGLKQEFKCLVPTCPLRSSFRNPYNEKQPWRFFRVPFRVSDRSEIFKLLKSEDPDFVIPTPKTINHICERHFDADQLSHCRERLISRSGLFPSINLDPTSNANLDMEDLDCKSEQGDYAFLASLKAKAANTPITTAPPKEECKCTVRSCNMANGMKKPSGVRYKLYRMPGNGIKRQEWYECLKRADPSWGGTRWSTYVCEKHFKDGKPTGPPTLRIHPPLDQSEGDEKISDAPATPPTKSRQQPKGDTPKLRMLTLGSDLNQCSALSEERTPGTSSLHSSPTPILYKLGAATAGNTSLKAGDIWRPTTRNWCCQSTKPLHASLARVEGKINCLFGMLKTISVRTTAETGKTEEFEEIQDRVISNSSQKIDSIHKTLTEQVNSPLGSVLPRTDTRSLPLPLSRRALPLPPPQFRDNKGTPIRFVKTSSGAHVLASQWQGSQNDEVLSGKYSSPSTTTSNVLKLPSKLPKAYNTGSGTCDSVSYQQQPIVTQTPEEKLKNFQKLMGKSALNMGSSTSTQSGTVVTLASIKAASTMSGPTVSVASSSGAEPRKFKVKLLRKTNGIGQPGSLGTESTHHVGTVAISRASDMPSLLPLFPNNGCIDDESPPALLNESMDSTVSSSSDFLMSGSGHSDHAKRLMAYRPGPKSVKKRRLEKLKEVLSAEGSSGQSAVEEMASPRPPRSEGQAMATVEMKALQDLSDLFKTSPKEFEGSGVEGQSEDEGPPPMTLISGNTSFNSQLSPKGSANFDAVIGRGILMFRGKSVSAEYLRENGRICFSNLRAEEIEDGLYRLCQEGALKKSVGSDQTVIPVGHRLFHKLAFEELPQSVVEKYQLDPQAYVQEYNAGKGTLRGIRMGRSATASSSVTNQMVLYQKMMDRKKLEAEEEAKSSCNDVVESNFDIDLPKKSSGLSMSVASSMETVSSSPRSSQPNQQLDQWREDIKKVGF